ncbi:N-formylglutamate amidohydrolase [Aestuariivirga litoralis]|uniref:N-formylglutamate amidohydrolase n=1 Tax=Aestuariivirga litoralis TaxID=2650924 RepID=UPI0018C7322F|nr:N-formylglutamate amidohydrolase [Aestuariivirga litoralis]
MTEHLFELLAPARWQSAIVFDSPHSGSVMPDDFVSKTRLNARDLRQSEDSHVDALFSGCLAAGAPMLRALASRAYLDLNREPYELDQRLFFETLPGYMNPGSSRVAAGFGTIPRLVGDGHEIYRGRLMLADALARIENFYKPYHRQLKALLDEVHTATGTVLLVDCHSMPSSAARPSAGTSRAVDVVLGDRFGSACAAEITTLVEEFLTSRGLHVVRNRPYAGGFITEVHGAPQHNRHALQIEINRGLYLNEHTLELLPNFIALKPIFDRLARELSKLMDDFRVEQTALKAAE